jgi:type II secretory pathway component GspD/PulD (secretin)
MMLNPVVPGRNSLRSLLLTVGILPMTFGFALRAQTPPEVKQPDTKPAESRTAFQRPKPDTYETLYITNGTQQTDLNDIQTAMRNVLPNAKIYGDPGQRAIVVYATQEDMALAKRLLADLDKKRNSYRLTYTLKESDGGKVVSTQHYGLIAVTGERTEMRLGNRIPIVSGKSDGDSSSSTTQVQYVDVGLNIDATLDAVPDSLRLRTKIEQSGLAEEKSGIGAQDPVIHQARLDGSSTLVLGKPLVIGSLDVPGSARHIEVEVLAELVK